MIFAAFFVPLGVYLLLLGHLNRRARPVVLSGTWDLIGLLFGLSGFLVLGGPAALTGLRERWRMFWLLADPTPFREGLEAYRPWWVLAALAYFLLVVGSCAWGFLRARRLTSVYNVEAEALRDALGEACRTLGLSPLVAGDLYCFSDGEASATLDLEPFDALKHVTLRWTPHDSPLRPVLERELERRLAEAGAADQEAGLWLTTSGLLVLLLALAAVVAVSVRGALGY